MRHLILFDIDGTLVRGGPAKEAFCRALEDTFGTTGDPDSVDFAGKTDPQIARELLQTAGLEDEAIDSGLPALWDGYARELEHRLLDLPMELLPGVAEVLDALDARVDVALGLVTGNIETGAALKLGSVGLAGRFPVGGFGSDHEHRNHLPGIAMRRALDAWGVAFAPDDVVVVGDTPRDVACGRHHRTRTVAVATGRFSAETLRRADPDHVFDDLSATGAVLEALVRAP